MNALMPSSASLAIMFSETAAKEPEVITVPVSFGKLIVLSAVGSTTVKLVSKSLAVAPSDIIVLVRKISND